MQGDRENISEKREAFKILGRKKKERDLEIFRSPQIYLGD